MKGFVVLVLLGFCHKTFAGIYSCSSTPTINNGDVRYRETTQCSSSGFDSSCVLRVRCDPGYTVSGSSFVFCDFNGDYYTWSQTPTCEESHTCDRPPSVDNGVVDLIGYGESVRYICDRGYTLLGNHTRNCLESGDWSGKQPTCEGNPICKDGKKPGTILNGALAQPVEPAQNKKFRVGTVLKYTCDGGHRMVGEPMRTCLNNGGWSAPKPKCIAVICAALQDTSIENGWSDAQNRTYYEGDIIRFGCNYGYRSIGKTWRNCYKGASNINAWSDTTPTCQEIHCPSIGSMENGNVLNEGDRRVGTTVTFRCQSGYYLEGPSEATCEPSGKWSGLSKCNAKNRLGCGNPGSPLNGRKTGIGYDWNDEVEFTCNHGFTLIGSPNRLCNRTLGGWTGEEPRCKDPNDFDDIDDVIRRMANATSAIVADIDETDNYTLARGRTIDINYEGGWNIYFIFDASNSVGKQYFEKGINFAKALVSKVGVGQIGSTGARYGAIVFASKATVVFHLSNPYNTVDDVNKIALEGAKDELTKGAIGGGTGTSEALRKLEQEMLIHTPDRPNAKSAIFLITDGKTNEGGNPVILATRLKEDHGMFIHCIGVGSEVDDEQLAQIASLPHAEHLFFLRDYTYVDKLAAAVTNTEPELKCGEGLGPFGGNNARGRIVGGNNAAPGAWPWVVGIYHWQFKDAIPEFFCGGSLISPDLILTAAHCFDPDNAGIVKLADDLIVAAGSHEKIDTLKRMIQPEPNLQILQVEEIIRHEQYDPDNTATFDYDIALLRLRRKADITTTVKTVCLPESGAEANKDLLLRGKNKQPYPYVTGWGSTEARINQDQRQLKLSHHLKQLAIPLKGGSTCRKSLNDVNLADTFTERMMCAGYDKGESTDNSEEVAEYIGEFDSCEGDSGGPLVRKREINNEDIYYQIGIVSWGVGCAQRGHYGFYTNLPSLVDWVQNKTAGIQ